MDKIDVIIKESIDNMLLEMAYPRSEFVSEIKNKTQEIIRNYALIYYSNKHNLQTVNHWRDELITYITDIQDMETKPKRGNRKMVLKAVQEVWITKMELNTHPSTIIHKYIAKFKEEGIFPSKEEHMEIAQSFINHMDALANEMAYGNYDSALTFVNSF